MTKDIERLRDFYGIPIVPPSVSIKCNPWAFSDANTDPHNNTRKVGRGEGHPHAFWFHIMIL